MTGRDVDRRRRCAAGVRVPWPAPRRDSRLERGDNPVGEFLVVVASLRGMASEVSHLAAPRNGIVPETASPPSHGDRRGKGAPAGRERPAKRLDPPNPCGGGRSMRDRSLSSLPSWRLHRPLFFILDEHASDPGARCARRLANDNGRSVLASCCLAALSRCGAGSRPYVPSLGVSSLNSRPPQGGLLFWR